MTKKPFHRNTKENTDNWIYGHHAAVAVLKNPKRMIKRILMTKSTQEELILKGINVKGLPLDLASALEIDQKVGQGAVHQGIAILADPLPELGIEDILNSPQENQTIILLDQITDPQNVGAILRSAAAFGVGAIITTERNSAHMGGALAKAASGALEQVPILYVTNLVRTIEDLKENGFWCAGLDEDGTNLDAQDFSGKWVLVMGAEGKGLRRLVKETCDYLLKIPTTKTFTTLNVSNAAAVVLYEVFRKQKGEKT